MRTYHGIIVEEGIDAKALRKLRILGRKRGREFSLLKVEVPAKRLRRIIALIQRALKSKKYYAHFYREGELIVVFKDKVFHIAPEKTTWVDAVGHGLSLGIPRRQLDFKPCRFEDETY